MSHRSPETHVVAKHQLPGATESIVSRENSGRGKKRVTPLVRRQTEPVSDALAGGETLNLDGSMGCKVHDGEYCVVDVPERSAGAGGAGAEEGTVLRA